MSGFEPTRWSVVLKARADPAEARKALETLCRTYRPPVLAYIKARGYPASVSEDLAQGFFARFIEDALHANARPERGRFRSYLLTAVRGYVLDDGKSARATKRGGGVHFEAIDDEGLDVTSRDLTPEEAFDREWALSVLRKALAQLKVEACSVGKERLFEVTRAFLIESPDVADYDRASAELGLRRNTLAVAVHRLRHRLRELVQTELQDTTASAED